MSKKNKIIWIVLLLIIEVAILFWIQGRYRTILAEGIAYQTPASVDIYEDFTNKNYLDVNIPVTSAVWMGKQLPEMGTLIYLTPDKDVEGMLFIKQATKDKPDGEYIEAKVLGYKEGRVLFDFPTVRVYLTNKQFQKLAKLELTEHIQVRDGKAKKVTTDGKGKINVIIRIHEGHVAIESLLYNGTPLDSAYTMVGNDDYVIPAGEK